MYLGIDLGTSGLKLVLLSTQHQVVASAHAPLTVQQPQPGWSEQDPHAWWQALQQAINDLRHTAPEAWRQVRAIGLSGQMHGAVVMGANDQVLRRAILWNDSRASAECAELEARVPELRRTTGNLAMPGFTAPKLLWLALHDAPLHAQVRRVLLPKDWLRWCLTGEAVSDMSDASGTGWLDVGQRSWNDALLAACGLDQSHMPRLVEGSAVSAYLKADIAAAWGLSAGLPVAGGAGDNAASAVGVGAAQPGQGLVSLGTSGVVFLASAAHAPAPEQAVHAFAHALPQRWHQMSVMLSAASAFSWAMQLTGHTNPAALSAHVAALPLTARAQAPVFLPYLAGERTPHNNPAASGALVGLRSQHGPAEVAYAVMEGVAFGLADGLQAMYNAAAAQTGAAPLSTNALQDLPALALVGGGARSDVWAALLASALGRVLHRPLDAESAAAMGAARLAWLADGGSLAEVCPPLPLDQVFAPDRAQRDVLAPRQARFKALYPALQGLF